MKLGRSEYFEADTAASEDPSLEKVEANYRGGEFEMQFACRFKGPNKPKEREIFGKVFVKKRREDGTEERLFEFNLIKVTLPYTVEPHYNKDLGTVKITLLYQVSCYIIVKKKKLKSWDSKIALTLF